MVQWLGFMFSSRKAQDQSLVGELRPYKPHGVAKKKKKKLLNSTLEWNVICKIRLNIITEKKRKVTFCKPTSPQNLCFQKDWKYKFKYT